MRSLEKIKQDNSGGYKPVKLPDLKPWNTNGEAKKALERRKKLNGKTAAQ